VHPVVEPRLPAVGAAGGVVRPAAPQLVVPVTTVKPSWSVVLVEELVVLVVEVEVEVLCVELVELDVLVE